MAHEETIRTRDVLPVYSRVSWGALLAGLFVTLAVFVVLSALGVAIGISASDAAGRDSIAVGAGVWAVATALQLSPSRSTRCTIIARLSGVVRAFVCMSACLGVEG